MSTPSAPKTRFSLKAVLAAMAVVAVLVAPVGWLGGMYATSLVCSCVLLGLVLWGIYRKKTVLPAVACVVAFFFSMMPAVMLQALGTFVALIVTDPLRNSRRIGATACVAVMAVVYGGMLHQAKQRVDRFDQTVARFPVTPVTNRLPQPKDQPITEVKLSEGVETNLQMLEEWSDEGSRYYGRADTLERLHQESTRRFVAAEGFGLMRMAPGLRYREDWLVGDDYATEAITLKAKEGELAKTTNTTHNHLLHRFFHPIPMGHAEDKDHTIGFQSHGVRQMHYYEYDSEYDMSADFFWNLTRLELIGLLRHDEPVVYIMEGLPTMDRVAEAETRPLDEFEAAALPTLDSEHDLQFEETDGGVRMVGAIRAAEQCLKCHEVARGTLIGAFSYDLVREEKSADGSD